MHFAKVDNQNLRAKHRLRRKLLKEMQFDSLRILDVCAGEGHVWEKLRKEFKTETYTPVDQTLRQPGQIRMHVTAHTVQAFDMAKFNVLDIDTHGEPWDIWHAAFQRITTPTAVFLTHGIVGAIGKFSHSSKAALGIPDAWNVPTSPALYRLADKYHLARKSETARVVKGYQIDLPTVMYFALRVEPQ